MSDEEKKAIEHLNQIKSYGMIMGLKADKDIDIILNLIEKQQKEIKESENYMKDKIREKIKEYDKIRLETKDSDLYDIMQDYIAVLSGLLKEE